MDVKLEVDVIDVVGSLTMSRGLALDRGREIDAGEDRTGASVNLQLKDGADETIGRRVEGPTDEVVQRDLPKTCNVYRKDGKADGRNVRIDGVEDWVEDWVDHWV